MPNEPLTSWKAIAAVFNRDVRTVQRWEKEEGLPVHRHLHHRRHSVWASREELEAWWEQRGAALTAERDSDGPRHEAAPLPPPPPEPPVVHGPGRALRAVLSATALALAVTTSGSTGRATTSWIEAAVSPLGSLPGASNIEVRGLQDLNGDGVDDLLLGSDPSGETLICFGPATATRDRPDVRVSVTGQRNVLGAPIGDVDGDGLTDLAVSVTYGEPETYYATGPTYLLRGRRVWPAGIELPRDADTTLFADTEPDIRLTVCLSAAGIDLDRDGLHDVVLGAADFSPPGLRSAGGVFVLFGRADWPDRINVVTAADIRMHGSYAGHGLSSKCGAGDFNADGLTDLAVLAGDDTLWALRGGYGSTYIFDGRDTWPAVLDAERDARLRVSSAEPAHWIAAPLLADVNGDGADDLVSTLTARSGAEGGTVTVVFGGQDDLVRIPATEADVVIEGRSPRFGYALAQADVDADGIADLLLSDPSAGLVHVIAGRKDWRRRGGLSDFETLSVGNAGARLTGRRLAVGDFDGDGGADVALDLDTEAFGLLRPALPLVIEIRPDASPNVLVPGGVVAIAVSSAGVPLSELDLSSLRAGGVPPSHVSWSGPSSLQLYFDVDRLRVRPNASRLAVVGRTRAGVPVFGADAIVVAAPGQSAAR